MVAHIVTRVQRVVLLYKVVIQHLTLLLIASKVNPKTIKVTCEVEEPRPWQEVGLVMVAALLLVKIAS